MAVNDLNSFTVHGVVTGLLVACLLSFAIIFMFYNNPTGLGSDADYVFGNSSNQMYDTLLESNEDANTLLNITANTNPEVSDLGSRDSVATSYSATGTAKKSFNDMKILMSWVFTGTTGKLLLGTITGIIGLLSYFYIYKHIRQGN